MTKSFCSGSTNSARVDDSVTTSRRLKCHQSVNEVLTAWLAEPSFELCDVLVLGSGIAACQAAIAAARSGSNVRMVGHARGASPYILGFNVPLSKELGDSPALFEEDTFTGGYSLGNRSLIGLLSREAEPAFDELVKAGVPFESAHGKPLLRHLSGSRFPRSVFVKSGTGTAIYRTLEKTLAALNVRRHNGLRVISLIESEGRVCGALAKAQDGTLHAFGARNTILALGGIGELYDNSTYPTDVVGDAFALALDAGATLVDMEFVQFEPTVVLNPERIRGMEMPTAMLGDGATLLNEHGERFMWRYNPEHGERLIEKAKMALCIQREIDEGRGSAGNGVWFDATMLSDECLRGYETHYRRLIGAGLDPAKHRVEIAPAAHSLMGGVLIDETCFTGVPGLFACGEAAGGLHGASRIAGNGASDAIVLSRVAGRTAAAKSASFDDALFRRAVQQSITAPSAVTDKRPGELVAKVSVALARDVGIRRTEEGLLRAVADLEEVEAEVAKKFDGDLLNPYRRARNAVSVAQAIARSALLRQESRGAHFRSDFPETNSDWENSIKVKRDDRGAILMLREPSKVEVCYE